MFAKKEAPLAAAQADIAEELDKDISIYTMPEKFRFVTVKASSDKKTGLIIVIIGGLFVLAMAIATYFFLFNKKPVAAPIPNDAAEQQTAEKIAEPEVPVQPKTAESPKDAYLRLKREMVLKSGDTPLMPTADEIGSITEEINGSYATLKAETKNAAISGVINMTDDGSGWKITDENWITLQAQSATTTPETPIEYKAGVDMDGDWLTDKEEGILGSNPNSSDSDNDTFSDISEFSNSYNPAGTGKLIENKNIAKYENKTFGYSLLYPAAWKLNAQSEESAIMRAEDNQFFQVISQPNSDRETIEKWYAKQFAIEEIPAGRIVESKTWKGVKSEDDLIIYLTDRKSENIFTLVYNPAGEILEYSNLFKLAVNTFELK